MKAMTDLEKEYFKLRYKLRMESTIKYLGEAEKITNKKEKSKFIKDKNKKTLEKYKITAGFIIEAMNSINTDTLKEIEEYFKDYHTLHTQYYNELRTDLFLDPVELVNWFESQGKKCGYCGISTEELEKITVIRAKDGKNNLTLNGKTKRSKGTLEIERTDSKEKIYKFSNLILACPLCNNAKSNLIDEKGWREIFATPMREYYKRILKKELLNPNPN